MAGRQLVCVFWAGAFLVGTGAYAAGAVDGSTPGASTAPATGQQNIADRLSLEEVVVSARRREESLTEVPASITALTSDFLRVQNIHEFADYATRIPNLTFQYGQGSDLQWSGSRTTTIRGVGGEFTTAYYINDTPVPATVSPQTLDLERIEVLKGPQGTLFGASSMGGNLRFITKQPSLQENSGTFHLQGGATKDAPGLDFDSSYHGNLVLVPGVVAVDAAFGYTHDTGYSTRRFPNAAGQLISKDNQGADDIVNASITLRAKPADRWDLSFNVIAQNTNLHGFPAAYVPLPAYRPLTYTEDRAQDVSEYSGDHWEIGSFVLKYTADGLALTSSTSYFSRHIAEKEDDTEGTNQFFESIGIPAFDTAFYNPSTMDQRLATHETRLSFDEGRLLPGLSAIVGIFYQHSVRDMAVPIVPVQALADAGLFPDNIGANSLHSTGDEKAVFGELYYVLAPKLTLTLGLRKYWIDQHAYPGPNYGFLFGPVVTQDPDTSNRQSGVVPKAVVSYKIGDQGNVYASASKGFRAGGANAALPDICNDDLARLGLTQNDIQRYKSDDLWSYEVGAKNRFNGGRLTASAALFEIDWSNIQQTALLPTCTLSFISNAGKARIRGGEFELSGKPLSDVPLSLQVGLGYTHAVLLDAGVLLQPANTSLTQVPSWTGTVSAYYERPITSNASFFAAADYSYTGPVKVSDGLAGFYERQSFNMLDGSVGISFGRSQILLYGKNLLDKRLNFGDQPSSGFERQTVLGDGSFLRLPRAVVSRPRQLGLQYEYNF